MSINTEVLHQKITWESKEHSLFVTYVDGKEWTVHLNPDFPLEDMFTLKIDKDTLNFNHWPENWDYD
ncbi:TPA: hypothetical protein JAN90_03450 [Legionella pneumophila]|uniref:hypothetical protein n=1 Tax=Legionella sp. PATHC039 TaxID=2992042 RepID=UPI00077876F0|nr:MULTISPECIES: hypothetical protein [Legionella]HAT8857397.1 hypothetical protein [Legionella pneumophila subsp. pneumophila]MCW8394799.1 hypothetical protein [Legionella sp. PATHC039]HAT7071841.1 hypothetical protein [Legionella pneumophila]HAT8640260.1 hypothetical protein [Legionella pneumophila]HAT8866941.1 hypothetical protein [Legionella pneumophila subsp. pneumophila]